MRNPASHTHTQKRMDTDKKDREREKQREREGERRSNTGRRSAQTEFNRLPSLCGQLCMVV